MITAGNNKLGKAFQIVTKEENNNRTEIISIQYFLKKYDSLSFNNMYTINKTNGVEMNALYTISISGKNHDIIVINPKITVNNNSIFFMILIIRLLSDAHSLSLLMVNP